MFKYHIPGPDARETVTYQFTGLDRRARIADGACREMRNLSTDDCPCLTVRRGRRRIGGGAAVTLLLHKDGKPFLVEGTTVKYDGRTVGSVTAGRKRAAVMNDWIFLWPDKKAFNAATGEFCGMEQHVGALAVRFTNSTVVRTDGGSWPFKTGDGVTIEGCAQAYNNRTAVVQSVTGNTLTFYDNVFQYGELGSEVNQNTHEWSETAVTLSRTVPDLEFVCEKDNRLWGVYENHICCCKLGDGFNWNVFNGLATDAFDVGVGSDGAFTAIAGFASYVLAFKENCVHKVYGSKPGNFTVNTSYVSGVQQGCADTVCRYQNVLYYLSREGVMAYGGGAPEPVGKALNCGYDHACAGMHGAKYYLSGVNGNGAELVVFDTERGLWAREDETEAIGFSVCAGTFYLLGADGGLWQCGTDDPVAWEAVFGPFESAGKKKSSRLGLVLSAEPGTVLTVETRMDGQGWRSAWSGAARRPDEMIPVPFLPVRGHGFRIRLRGRGRVTLHAINQRFKEGSAR